MSPHAEIHKWQQSQQNDGAPLVQECGHLRAAIPQDAVVVALDRRGIRMNTEHLTDTLRQWMQTAQDVCLLIGDADRLSEKCWQCADIHWSLSELTFSHGLVRAMVAEQLYRARSMIRNHPYNRA